MVRFENGRMIIEAESTDNVEDLVNWQGALINVCMSEKSDPYITSCLMQLLNILMPDCEQQKQCFKAINRDLNQI